MFDDDNTNKLGSVAKQWKYVGVFTVNTFIYVVGSFNSMLGQQLFWTTSYNYPILICIYWHTSKNILLIMWRLNNLNLSWQCCNKITRIQKHNCYCAIIACFTLNLLLMTCSMSLVSFTSICVVILFHKFVFEQNMFCQISENVM
jgi:hypothetical protein